MNKTDIQLRKQLKLIVPANGSETNEALVATLNKNLETLGFSLSRGLANRLAKQSAEYITTRYRDMLETLRQMVGAHVKFNPMYPNFPKQVMEMNECQLYLGAIYHYITLDSPNLEDEESREPLSEKTTGKVIQLGTEKDFRNILTQLAAGNSSLSATDKEILEWLLANMETPEKALPPVIPQRETRCIIATAMLQKNPEQSFADTGLVGTATDVLRIATQLSGGDISLAAATRYKKFPRALRRAMLAALETCGDALEEDMLRHKGKWIRLGEILHPGQYATRFPRTAAAFEKLRKNVPIATFNSKTEAALRNNQWGAALGLLITRPGELLRKLDRVLRGNPNGSADTIQGFREVAPQMATPALLNLHQHFKNRLEKQAHRIVFPKGSTSKAKVIPCQTTGITPEDCQAVMDCVEATLKARFAKLPALGNVYLDENLALYPVPFAQRSASKALRTLPRGSHAPLDDKKDGTPDTLRFFIWWKNGKSDNSWADRVDLDLSCEFLDEQFASTGTVSYYNLREYGGTHSGDITDAPNGAAEFIDISIARVLATGARYIAAVVFSYTNQPFRDLPECFSGWMTRHEAQSGEIFDARTVKNKADLTGDTKCAIPVIIDLKSRKAIWLDISLGAKPNFSNNVHNNKANIGLVCKRMANLRKPNLHTLLRLHAEARGTLVNTPKGADTCFDEAFAYENDRIAAEFIQ